MKTSSDAVVVGAGIAGLMTAITLAREGRKVAVLSKVALGDGASTGWAQGGIAAAIGAGDSPRLHAEDTLAAAGGIADAAVVTLLTGDAPDGIAALVDLGVPFDRGSNGELALGREAAHAHRRIVHSGGDATGRAVLDALIAAVRRLPGIAIVEHADARALLIGDDGAYGILARVADETIAFTGSAVVLASGGIGGLFAATTNPLEACGDGLALAARAGAQLSDLEFIQFHPTALAAPGSDPMPLITEALRGEGAVLINDRGERFMPAIDPAAELAPRDVVARAIFARITAGERVFLDTRAAVSAAAFPSRFPTVFALCRTAGIDPRTMPIPVAPAAHYHMGGIAVDAQGRTSIDGLWACGEVAATGVHGANRLASNSLLEGLVFARRSANDICSRAERRDRRRVRPAEIGPRARVACMALRQILYERVGVVRDEAGLEAGLTAIEQLGVEGAEDPDRLAVAQLLARAALARRESRGSHFRSDYPNASAAFAHRSFISTV